MPSIDVHIHTRKPNTSNCNYFVIFGIISETLSFNEPHIQKSSNNGSDIIQAATAAAATTTMRSNIMTTTDIESPYFDFELQRNVTVTVGQTGFLHCRVEQLGDKDVSKWIKCFVQLFAFNFVAIFTHFAHMNYTRFTETNKDSWVCLKELHCSVLRKRKRTLGGM